MIRPGLRASDATEPQPEEAAGVPVHETTTDASGLRLAVVVARFNHLVSARLLEGCMAELAERGAAERDVEVVWVPGAFEIPQAARWLVATGRFSAIVTLGAVIRGGTPHFDFVCAALTDGVREVMRDTICMNADDVAVSDKKRLDFLNLHNELLA